MSFEKGTISIHAQNLMPVIKKWMYSDKDIFVREIVSNGCDAVAKYKALAARGEAEERDEYRVDVTVDKEAGTIAVSDNGIGTGRARTAWNTRSARGPGRPWAPPSP